jgi:hypothetical protein
MIAELLANSVALSKLAYENAQALDELYAARAAADGAAPAARGNPLTHELLEIVTLQAQQAGVTPEHYLREAVLAYIAQAAAAADGDGDGGSPTARAAEARRAAGRVRAQNRAVTAQSERAIAHSEAAQAQARAQAEATERASRRPPR